MYSFERHPSKRMLEVGLLGSSKEVFTYLKARPYLMPCRRPYVLLFAAALGAPKLFCSGFLHINVHQIRESGAIYHPWSDRV